MESLIGLVNRIQRACTVLGDYGGGDNAFSSLWEALPSVAVVGGQVLLPFSLLICFLSYQLRNQNLVLPKRKYSNMSIEKSKSWDEREEL